ncbi:MAG: hypothetical protein QGI76_03835 [Dehalococcoidia bacterium]|nr:hypothetical protein [Dehalococcoidia bacterium]
MEYRKLGNLEGSVIGPGTLRAFDVTEEADLVPAGRSSTTCWPKT